MNRKPLFDVFLSPEEIAQAVQAVSEVEISDDYLAALDGAVETVLPLLRKVFPHNDFAEGTNMRMLVRMMLVVSIAAVTPSTDP